MKRLKHAHFKSPLFSILALGALAFPLSGHAQQVDAGYDLLQTQAGTTFDGAEFTGVQLSPFNFGGAVGTQAVPNTDAIIQRLANAMPVGAVPGGSATIGIQMDALQLVTTAPTALGSIDPTVQNYYITLNPNQASTGTMSITWNTDTSGTFTSSLDLNIEILTGGFNGTVVADQSLTLANSGSYWGTNAPAGSTLIEGANYLLNGIDTSNDFWIPPPLQAVGNWPLTDNAGDDLNSSDPVPEVPSTLVLFFASVLCLLAVRLRSSVRLKPLLVKSPTAHPFDR